MPRVTAIITAFNREGLVGGAIQSVLNQVFDDFELIVLDNSSTDNTENIVRSFADARIRYCRHPRVTIADQRNLGLGEATGEFIAFLDDDDEWLPEKLAKQVQAFDRGSADVGLMYGGFTRVDSEGKEFWRHEPVLRGKVLTELLWQRDAFTGSASNPMLRSSVLRSLGGYGAGIASSEDWELYLRLAERYEVDFVPDVVVRIRSHRGARLGDRIAEACRVERLVLERYGEMMEPALRSFYLQKIGGKLCRVGSLEEGRRRIREAIRRNPFNIVAYLQYSASFLGSHAYGRIHSSYRRVYQLLRERGGM